jgi:hypothetical protein
VGWGFEVLSPELSITKKTKTKELVNVIDKLPDFVTLQLPH